MTIQRGKSQKSMRLAARGVAVPTTLSVRESFARMLEHNSSKFSTWLTQVAEGHNYKRRINNKFVEVYVPPDPARALDLVVKIAEYHIPKLQRTELTGKDGGPVIVQSTPQDEQL